jgi:hypothetical protein
MKIVTGQQFFCSLRDDQRAGIRPKRPALSPWGMFGARAADSLGRRDECDRVV